MTERARPEAAIARTAIKTIVERVVAQVVDSHANQLRSEIVRRVMEEIAAQPAAAAQHHSQSASDAASAASVDLARAVAEIQMGSSQRDVLRTLLDTSARYATRVALFIIKSGHATGWQGRGFIDNDAVKEFALDDRAPALVCALRDRIGISAPSDEMDARFLQAMGAPVSGGARILPLMLKDKVAALVYADRGTGAGGHLETGSLDVLVLATSAWLEVNSLRKEAQKDPLTGQADGQSIAAVESHPMASAPSPAPAFNDPFAAHAPAFGAGSARAAAAGAPGFSGESHDDMQSPAPAFRETAVVTPHIEPSPAALSAEDEDVHRKAQRFARLLVDEIKLYNQAKVTEGKRSKDLYERLRDTIEKSRATYQKRYGSTAAASGNYFEHEIIRSLAEDDPSIMGASFRQ